jgi:hypothetical protein
MLTEWFNANKQYEDAKELTYYDFPKQWRWNGENDNGRKDNTISKLEGSIM